MELKKEGEMKKNLGRVALWVVLAGIIGLGGIPLQAKAAELPKMMTWTAYDIGSSGYMMAGYIGESLWEKYKIKVRVIPAGTDLPRVFPLRLKDADFAFHEIGSYLLEEGMF